jgi:hypothetical protein
MKRFWHTTCRNCDHQGRLVVMKHCTSGRLYLHCDECESGWSDPSSIDDRSAKFLALDEDSKPADWRDIELARWQAFATHLDEDSTV